MADTRLTPEVDLEGMSPEEAFAVLGNETRLDVVRVLWRAGAIHEYDDVESETDTTIPFSTLRRRVDVEDNGQFNYHLSKLRPHFVRRTDEGYRLTGAGRKIARAVVAIAGQPDPGVVADPGIDCPLCGAPVAAGYDVQWLRYSCTECEGLFGDAAPEGAILHASLPPAGLSEWASKDALSTGLFRCMLDLTYLARGVCRECAASVETTVSVCEDHDPDENGSCGSCGTPFAVWVDSRCGTCRFAKRLPIEIFVMGLTPTIGFLYQQGLDVLSPSLDELVEVLRTQVETSIEQDPRRVIVTVRDGSEKLVLTLDERMNLLDVGH
jgi:hypothetical protein